MTVVAQSGAVQSAAINFGTFQLPVLTAPLILAANPSSPTTGVLDISPPASLPAPVQTYLATLTPPAGPSITASCQLPYPCPVASLTPQTQVRSSKAQLVAAVVAASWLAGSLSLPLPLSHPLFVHSTRSQW